MKKIFLVLSMMLLLTGCFNNDDKVSQETTSVEEETTTQPEPVKEPEPEPERFFSPLSGLETTKDKRDRRIVAVMLDNHSKARPQAGLSQAEVVYEFEVEGDFTRYMALFLINDPEIIGPVRSSRHYFVDRVMEYDGIYGHYGGSPQGYDRIRGNGVDNIDGMALEGSTYYRNKKVGKKAPHNAYTSMELLRSRGEEYGYTFEEQAKGFDFSTEDTHTGEVCTEFNVLYKDWVKYVYNEGTGSYDRFIKDKATVDENNDVGISPKNIILQVAGQKVIDKAGHLDVYHVGNGEGYLVKGGRVYPILWEKATQKAPTVFTYADGQPITLIPGQTWIEVIKSSELFKIVQPEPEEVVEGEEE